LRGRLIGRPLGLELSDDGSIPSLSTKIRIRNKNLKEENEMKKKISKGYKE
jgi:hypothetical protein